MKASPNCGASPPACIAPTATCATASPSLRLLVQLRRGRVRHLPGFGRVIGVDWGLVIPNDKLTLRSGAIKPIQTPAWQEAQDDLMRHAEAAGIPRDTPWYQLTAEQKKWVIEGSPELERQMEPAVVRHPALFDYLESKAYKMHIRVLLSKYRSYTPCPVCAGARLKTESLLWRIGRKEDADAVMEPANQRFMPQGVQWSREQLEALPGLCLHDLMLLPIDRLRQFFARMQLPVGDDAKGGDAQALKLLHEEITARLTVPVRRGHWLPHARPAKPHALSGGEVQRINLTTALGTSLVNTCSCWTSPALACTRATCTASPRPCCACAMRATPWWWWSTTPP